MGKNAIMTKAFISIITTRSLHLMTGICTIFNRSRIQRQIPRTTGTNMQAPPVAVTDIITTIREKPAMQLLSVAVMSIIMRVKPVKNTVMSINTWVPQGWGR